MRENFKSDLLAGIVVFLVAVPLCLGIAFASGADPITGLLSGIIGGSIALVSRSALGVSGPAAGLVVIVLTAIQTLGFEKFLLALVLAGVIQVVLGFVRAGLIAYFFPTSVITGMLSGIGLILILKQFAHLVGYDADFEGDVSFMQPDGHNTFSEIFYALQNIHIGAFIVGVGCLGILILWDSKILQRFSFTKIIQGPIVVVLVGIFLNEIFKIVSPSIAIYSITHMVNVPIIWELEGGALSFLKFPDFSNFFNIDIYITAFTLAMVASIETLLCVEATDKLDPLKRNTPANLELKAQGIGNIVAGLIGALPITQVIVRSSTNLSAGAKSKWSAFYHGILILTSIVLFPAILNKIPLSALAAILIMVGYKLTKISIFRRMYKLGIKDFAPFIVTVTAILLTDLLKGVLIGTAVSIMFILDYHLRRSGFSFKRKLEKDGKPTFVIILPEHVGFLNKARLRRILSRTVLENSQVLIDASKTMTVDTDILEVIRDFKSVCGEKNIKLNIKGELKNNKLLVD